ncbi:MAG: HD domain-containing phosphohydrolase [Coriobacteriales bacterium]
MSSASSSGIQSTALAVALSAVAAAAAVLAAALHPTAPSVLAASVMLLVVLKFVWLSHRSSAEDVHAPQTTEAETLSADNADVAELDGSRRRERAPSRVPATLEADVMLRALMDAFVADYSPVAAHLWLEDPGSGTLRVVATVGPMSPPPRPVPLDDPCLGAAVRDGRATLSPIARLQIKGAENVVWRFSVPLSAGQARGVMAVDLACTHDPDASELQAVSSAFCGPVAGTLALHVARTETEMATTLIEVARDLSRLLDPEQVLSTALDRAMAVSGAVRGSVMLVDPTSGKLGIVVSRGVPSEVVEQTALSAGEGIAGWVLATGQPLLIEDLPSRTRAVRRHAVRSAVSVPICDGDEVLGVLNVGSRDFPARFTDSHLKGLEILGRQTAVALRNARAVSSSRELYFDTLQALAAALETKDPYARGGTERVLDYATAAGEAFGLEPEHLEALRIAALLHDIGMDMNVVGARPGGRPLSTVERGLIKLHPQIAAEILQEIPALRDVAPIVYHHHEWYDGHGYLGGIAGESIPLGARILAVVDAYVAMTSDRPYRAAMTPSRALAELRDKAGTQFDPAVVDVFEGVVGSDKDLHPDVR